MQDFVVVDDFKVSINISLQLNSKASSVIVIIPLSDLCISHIKGGRGRG